MASSTCSFYSPPTSIQFLDPFPRTNISIRKVRTITTRAARRDQAQNHNFEGRLVDENLIVLRKRIHEMKMMEMNYEAPEEWMDWEKRLYAGYDAVICDAMGHLQTYLMETRPSLLLAAVALIAFSVPISTALVMYNLLQLVLPSAGIHLN